MRPTCSEPLSQEEPYSAEDITILRQSFEAIAGDTIAADGGEWAMNNARVRRLFGTIDARDKEIARLERELATIDARDATIHDLQQQLAEAHIVLEVECGQNDKLKQQLADLSLAMTIHVDPNVSSETLQVLDRMGLLATIYVLKEELAEARSEVEQLTGKLFDTEARLLEEMQCGKMDAEQITTAQQRVRQLEEVLQQYADKKNWGYNHGADDCSLWMGAHIGDGDVTFYNGFGLAQAALTPPTAGDDTAPGETATNTGSG